MPDENREFGCSVQAIVINDTPDQKGVEDRRQKGYNNKKWW
jgi:hypothetical protein